MSWICEHNAHYFSFINKGHIDSHFFISTLNVKNNKVLFWIKQTGGEVVKDKENYLDLMIEQIGNKSSEINIWTKENVRLDTQSDR